MLHSSFFKNLANKSNRHNDLNITQILLNLFFVIIFQGSYRQVCVKFKIFSRTSKDYPTVFKDYKCRKNPDLSVKILLQKC